MGNQHGRPRLRRRRLDLMTLDPDEVEDIPYQGQKIPCRICDVYDGDSFTGLLNFHNYPIKIKIRLLGVDAPEMVPRGVKDPELRELEKRAATIVRDHICHIILNKIVMVELIDHDKYGGRLLAHVYIDNDGVEQLLSEHLIDDGYVRRYHGERKEPWTEAELVSGPYAL